MFLNFSGYCNPLTEPDALKNLRDEIVKVEEVLKIYSEVTESTEELKKFVNKIQDVRFEKEKGFVYHCDLKWGYEFKDADGQSENINSETEPTVASSADCKKPCEEYQECECWTWIEEEKGKGRCLLKNEDNCEVGKLSRLIEVEKCPWQLKSVWKLKRRLFELVILGPFLVILLSTT